MSKKLLYGSKNKRVRNEMKKIMLRLEYIRKLNKIDKEKGISFKNISELRKIIEGKN